MPWQSLRFLVDSKTAEPLSDALMEAGALSVALEDADAGTLDETPLFGEPDYPTAELWQRSVAVALFDEAADVHAILREAAVIAGVPAPAGYTVETVADADWVRLTQSQFDPIPISPRLWIVPTWHDAPDASAINLKLDPGLAFGTGSHPTTRLCLEWLCANVRTGASVLDYGCGSGILAIAAAKLGARPVVGVDIDENALAAAAANAERNGVALQLAHSRHPLDTAFDIVVANILTNPLCVLAPLLAERTRIGGRIALSGILTTQIEQVRQAYRTGFDLTLWAEMEGWALLEGVRK